MALTNTVTLSFVRIWWLKGVWCFYCRLPFKIVIILIHHHSSPLSPGKILLHILLWDFKCVGAQHCNSFMLPCEPLEIISSTTQVLYHHLLWWDVKCLSSHVNLLIDVHTGDDEKYTCKKCLLCLWFNFQRVKIPAGMEFDSNERWDIVVLKRTIQQWDFWY